MNIQIILTSLKNKLDNSELCVSGFGSNILGTGSQRVGSFHNHTIEYRYDFYQGYTAPMVDLI